MKVCSRCKVEKHDSEFRLRRETRGKRGGGKLVYLNNTCRKCDVEIQNAYYFAHKDDPVFLENWRKKSRDYHSKNREKCNAKQKQRRNNPEFKKYMREYCKKNQDRIREKDRPTKLKWSAKHRDNITDQYCIQLIRSQNGGKEKCGEITAQMIEQKRLQIKLKRKIHEIKRKIEPSGSNDWLNAMLPGVDLH